MTSQVSFPAYGKSIHLIYFTAKIRLTELPA